MKKNVNKKKLKKKDQSLKKKANKNKISII